MKVILTILLGINLLSADDFTISREKLTEKEITIPKPSFETENVKQTSEQFFETKTGEKILPTKELTIMVFINAKNNLEMAGLLNVNDMERIGSTKNVNIIVELGRMNGQIGDTDEDGNWVGVRRYYIKKDTDTKKITSPVIYSKTGPGAYDMGDFKKVIEFVNWTKRKYPANRYILILWDHGTGWLDPRKKKTATKGISFDDETGNYITTEEIGQIISSVGGVDILAFDACLMQMAEVLAEVKDYTKIVIGSEETVPAYGYPYALFLDPITKNPYMSDEQIASTIVKAFEKFYSYVKMPATLSAVRANRVDGLFDKVRYFSTSAMEANEIEALKKARKEVIRYDILGESSDPDKHISFFGDISDFARIVSKNISNNNEKSMMLKLKAEELVRYIETELIIARGSYGKERTGKDLSLSKGVSVYIPPVITTITYEKIDSILQHPYSNFRFAKETGWDKFVRFLYEKAK